MKKQFITGPAGTGKSEFVKRMADEDPSSITLTSTTGISAMNMGVRTLNSLLVYFNTESLIHKVRSGKLRRTLLNLQDEGRLGRSIGIDEVSMMEADQLDIITREIDSAFRGDKGIILTGDFAQLPPVEGKFAFEAQCWPKYEENMIVLDKIWRQNDPKFLEALALIRGGDGVEGGRALVSAGAEFASASDPGFGGITLVPTNQEADRINGSQLAQLSTNASIYMAEVRGKSSPDWAQIPPVIMLKPGARVMVTANDSEGSHANGDLGEFIDGSAHGARIRLDRTGEETVVNTVTRRWLDYSSTPPKFLGEITFMPLKLAYALTVHKSQGLTLPSVQVHIGHWFSGAPALVYVALSRVREAANVRVVGTVQELEKRIVCHPKVGRWL